MNSSGHTAQVSTPAPRADVPVGPHLADLARGILRDRVDRCQKALGAVVVLIDAEGSRLVTHGRVTHGDRRTLTEDSVFELGCVAKVFDALLLADMVERGEVALTDPIADYLPPDVMSPRRGPSITFQHLATHTSGLPGRHSDPTADALTHTLAGLYQFLATYTSTREAGAYYEYSNVGFRLLRHVITLRLGTGYEILLRTRICEPLGMRMTAITPTPEMLAHLAIGHNDRLEVSRPNPFELRSTAADMSLFIGACLGLTHSPLDRAFQRMLSVRCPSGPKVEAALGWEIERHGGDDIICRNGMSVSSGFRSWIGYRPSVQRGIVIWSNAAAAGALHDVGYHLLDARYPLLPPNSPLLRPPAMPVAVEVPSDVLEGYAGRYQLTPNVAFVITRDDNQLYAERPDGRVAIFPESPVRFFCKEVEVYDLPADTRLTFNVNDAGAAVGMTLHQRGHDTWLPRVGRDREPVWFGHAAVRVAADRLERYVGAYRLEAGAGGYRLGSGLVTITLDGDQLIAGFDGRVQIPLVPEGERAFFIENDVINMHITFEVDADGRTSGLVATYDGMPRRGVRIAERADA